MIAICYADHPPPHFHAKYGDHEIRVAIEDGAPALMEDWALAEQRKRLRKIEPLE